MSVRFVVVSLLACLVCAASPPPSAPCIPDGGSSTHCTEVILAAGDRVGGIAKEDDPFSDDVVGEPTITYDKEKGVAKLCIEILDADGDLHGNNNDVQDVGTEGDCIEVYIEVRFKFDAGWSIGVGGASASAESTSGTSDSATTEFCPC